MILSREVLATRQGFRIGRRLYTQASKFTYYDAGLIAARYSSNQDDNEVIERQNEERGRAKRMVFDPSHGIQPPSFDQVFGGTNKSTKSSRRDVSYREVNRMIAGVQVPKRPIEPDSCCMSGCVNCVWDLFSEDLEFWKLKTGQAKRALQLQGDNVKEKWPLGFDPPPDGLPDKYIPRELLTRRGNGKKRTELPVGFKVFQDFEKKKKVEKFTREKTLLEETAIPEQDDLRQQAGP